MITNDILDQLQKDIQEWLPPLEGSETNRTRSIRIVKATKTLLAELERVQTGRKQDKVVALALEQGLIQSNQRLRARLGETRRLLEREHRLHRDCMMGVHHEVCQERAAFLAQEETL